MHAHYLPVELSLVTLPCRLDTVPAPGGGELFDAGACLGAWQRVRYVEFERLGHARSGSPLKPYARTRFRGMRKASTLGSPQREVRTEVDLLHWTLERIGRTWPRTGRP